MSCIKHSVSTGWTIVGQTPRVDARLPAREVCGAPTTKLRTRHSLLLAYGREFSLIFMRSENYKKVEFMQANRATSHRHPVEFYHMARSFRALLISVPPQTYLCSFPLVVCIHVYIFFTFFFFKKVYLCCSKQCFACGARSAA